MTARPQQEVDTPITSLREEETMIPQRPGHAHPREQEHATATPKTNTRDRFRGWISTRDNQDKDESISL